MFDPRGLKPLLSAFQKVIKAIPPPKIAVKFFPTIILLF